MSAYVVDDEHIHLLLHAGIHHRLHGSPLGWLYADSWRYLHPENANEVGQMLIDANYKSVGYRYREPGIQSPVHYRYSPPRTITYPIVQVLKAVNALAYQSDEFPEWGNSEAKAFLDSLQGAMIRLLPGYDEAPWSY